MPKCSSAKCKAQSLVQNCCFSANYRQLTSSPWDASHYCLTKRSLGMKVFVAMSFYMCCQPPAWVSIRCFETLVSSVVCGKPCFSTSMSIQALCHYKTPICINIAYLIRKCHHPKGIAFLTVGQRIMSLIQRESKVERYPQHAISGVDHIMKLHVMH